MAHACLKQSETLCTKARHSLSPSKDQEAHGSQIMPAWSHTHSKDKKVGEHHSRGS